MKKKLISKKVLIVTIIIVGIILIGTVSFALFTALQSKNSTITIGKINVNLEEDWPDEEEQDEYGLEKYTKKIKGVSTEQKDAYVRVRLIPVVEYKKDDEWITAPVAQDDIVLTVEGDSWVRQGEYYYYKSVLHGYEETEELSLGWQLDEIPSEISSYDIRVDVRVILEYSQTTNNVWKDIFQIDSLPEGVEIVE